MIGDPAFARIKEAVIEHTGLAYYLDKDEALADRIAERLAKLALPDCGAYWDFLQRGEGGEAEMDALIVELTIGETYFFRHREQLDALKLAVIPEIIRRNAARRSLRVWSVGCASGEEAYSLSILLKDDFKRELDGWDVTILATDINRHFLARAREGVFRAWAFRTNPDAFKLGRFHAEGASWVLEPRYREGVTFQFHNLAKSPFPSQDIAAFDLIVCRNVMIYFSPENSQRIISRLGDCLADGGWLLLGHCEGVTLSPTPFTTVQANGIFLYRLGDAPPAEAAAAPATDPWRFHELTAASAPAPAPAAREARAPQRPDLDAARLLADEGRWEASARICEAVLREDSLNAPAHFLHSMVLEQLGEPARAEEAMRRALYLDRANPVAHYHLGLFLLRRTDEAGARRSFRNVLLLLDRLGAGADDGRTASELLKLTSMRLEAINA